LIRLLGDFDAAKAALHDAFARSDRAMGTSRRVGRSAGVARVDRLATEYSRKPACIKNELMAARSVVGSFSSCRWFGVCRDIGRTPSSVRCVYYAMLEVFTEITEGYENRLTLDLMECPLRFHTSKVENPC
jgi:hypothetical protein